MNDVKLTVFVVVLALVPGWVVLFHSGLHDGDLIKCGIAAAGAAISAIAVFIVRTLDGGDVES